MNRLSRTHAATYTQTQRYTDKDNNLINNITGQFQFVNCFLR